MRRFFAILLFVVVALTGLAQHPKMPRNRVMFGVGFGGNSFAQDWNLFYPSTVGGNLRGSVGYLYYINYNFGLYGGLDFAYAGGGYHADRYTSESQGFIEVSDGVIVMTIPSTFTITTEDVKERYHSLMLAVPVLVHIQTYSRSPVFFRGGLKLAVPLTLSATYTYGHSEMGVGGEIDGTGTMLEDIIPRVEHDEVSGVYDARLSSPVQVLGSLEAGWMYRKRSRHVHPYGSRLRRNYYIFGFSTYLDFSLWETSVASSSSNGLVSYANGSWHFSNCLQSDMVRRMGSVSLGLRFTWDFGFGADAPQKHR